MKTQISNLRSGKRHQVLNDEVDYSIYPKASSHVGHAGSNQAECEKVFAEVVKENPEVLRVRIQGITYKLRAQYSVAGNLKEYYTPIPDVDMERLTPLTGARNATASLSIAGATQIVIHNGKKAYIHVCPSLVEIL